MLPLRDDVALRSAPIAVAALLVANGLVFAASVAVGPEQAGVWFERWGLVPRVFLRSLAGAPESSWLTPFTAMFLHAGPLHLAGNALYLWIFGRHVEDLLGRRRMLIFYGACGLAAALVHVAAQPSSYLPTIGASGAVSGLLGAYAVAYPTGRLRLVFPAVRVPAIAFLFVWITLQVVSGLASTGEMGGGVAWWAHVGGFVAGATLTRSMWQRRPTRSRVGI